MTNPRFHPRFPDSLRLKVACEYAAGVPIKITARDYGITKAFVCNIAKQYHIPRRGMALVTGHSKVNTALLLELYDHGARLKDIAHVCQTTTSYVSYMARKSGRKRYRTHIKRSPHGLRSTTTGERVCPADQGE